MHIIDLPHWNDLPPDIRAALVKEGEYWDAFIGSDMAHAMYSKLRVLLDGVNIERPDPSEPKLDLPDPSRRGRPVR